MLRASNVERKIEKHPMGKLSGQTALVTGGGSGIGLAVAKALLQEGAQVAISGRNADKLRRAADSLGAGDRLLHHAADVTDPNQVRSLVSHAVERLGPIDMLIN